MKKLLNFLNIGLLVFFGFIISQNLPAKPTDVSFKKNLSNERSRSQAEKPYDASSYIPYTFRSAEQAAAAKSKKSAVEIFVDSLVEAGTPRCSTSKDCLEGQECVFYLDLEQQNEVDRTLELPQGMNGFCRGLGFGKSYYVDRSGELFIIHIDG